MSEAWRMKPLRLHRETIVAIRLAEAVGLGIGGFSSPEKLCGETEKRPRSIAATAGARTPDAEEAEEAERQARGARTACRVDPALTPPRADRGPSPCRPRGDPRAGARPGRSGPCAGARGCGGARG